MKLTNYITRNFPYVDKNETLYHAFKLTGKYGIDKVVVTEKTLVENREIRKLAGILTSRDLVSKLATKRIRLVTPGRLHVSSFMSLNPVYVTIYDDLSKAISIMAEKGYGILPVTDNHDLEGVILRDSILKLLENDDTEIRHVMEPNPVTLRTTDRFLKARQEMLRRDLSFIPVVDERNELIGYVTITELAYVIFKFQDIVPEKYRKERIMHLIVEDIMRFRPPRLRITDTISTAVSYILQKKSRGAVVVDEIGYIAGIVTSHNLIHYLHEIHAYRK